MLKKILYLSLFIVLAVGAYYSYEKVDFSRKTAMFFQVVFGDDNTMGGRSGRPPTPGNRGEDMSRPAISDSQVSGPMREGGERGGRPSLGQDGNRGSRPSGRGAKGRAPGGVISLGNVIAYAFILAFSVMIIRLLDQLIVRFSRSRRLS